MPLHVSAQQLPALGKGAVVLFSTEQTLRKIACCSLLKFDTMGQ